MFSLIDRMTRPRRSGAPICDAAGLGRIWEGVTARVYGSQQTKITGARHAVSVRHAGPDAEKIRSLFGLRIRINVLRNVWSCYLLFDEHAGHVPVLVSTSFKATVLLPKFVRARTDSFFHGHMVHCESLR